MRDRRKWLQLAFVFIAVCLAWPFTPPARAQQEPILVGRIAYVQGELLRYVPEIKDWVITRENAPFGMNDALYSGASAKAEFTFPNGLLIRIDSDTQIQLIALKNDASEVDIAAGIARFYNRNPDGMLKVTTPFGYVLADPGAVFDVYVGDRSVEILGLNGRAGYFQDGARYDVIPGGVSIVADATQVASGEETVDARWDDWNADRDTLLARRSERGGESVRYLPPELDDYAYELDQTGRWERVMYRGSYQMLWRPAIVAPTWAPFTVGRWTDYYGDQVWIPDEPFGYVTCHYGNWVRTHGRWFWAPPVPAGVPAFGPFIPFGWYPGRVAWIGTGADIGWIPLAPREIYYSHHYWGPSSMLVTAAPAAAIAIGALAYASAAVIVPQASFYSVTSYRSVRIVNIHRRTIIRDFRAYPVVNRHVYRHYARTNAKYNFINRAPTMKPYAAVDRRILRNRRMARTSSRSLTASTLRREFSSGRSARPHGRAAVQPPRKLTSKLVPSNMVNAPRNRVRFRTVEIKRHAKPASSSSAGRFGTLRKRGPRAGQKARPMEGLREKRAVPRGERGAERRQGRSGAQMKQPGTSGQKARPMEGLKQKRAVPKGERGAERRQGRSGARMKQPGTPGQKARPGEGLKQKRAVPQGERGAKRRPGRSGARIHSFAAHRPGARPGVRGRQGAAGRRAGGMARRKAHAGGRPEHRNKKHQQARQ